jgi:hypothetical protein
VRSRPRIVLLALLSLLPVLWGCEDPESQPQNRKPLIESVSAEPATVAAGDSVEITVTASDPDGDDLVFSYTPDGGTVAGAGAQVTWIAPESPGTYSVHVTVTDSRGGSADCSVDITVALPSSGIRGAAEAAPGPQIDLRNARVAIYPNDYDEWVLDRYVLATTAVGTESTVGFLFTGVPADTYFLDFWKDTNGDGQYNAGDLFGFHGSGEWPNDILFQPIPVVPGNVTDIDTLLVRRLQD